MANPFNGLFDNIINGALSPKGNLGDYQHASKVFVDGNMRLAPKMKYLYHVVLNINPNITLDAASGWNNTTKREINLLCKSVDLPSFSMATETLNQYNRKKVIQTSVNYDPINMVWHDDNAGLTSFLWKNYFNYYYSDANHVQQNEGAPAVSDPAYLRTGGLNSGYDSGAVSVNRFGLDRPGKTDNFFTSIQVFQLHPQNGQSTNTSFTYINPLIDQWDHDEANSEASEFAINRMRFSYESVMTDRDYTKVGSIPAGFGDYRYDTAPSPISPAGGGGSSFFGTGGVLAGASSTLGNIQDGNLIGALITGANTVRNSRGLSIGGLVNEVIGLGEETISNRINNVNFPGSTPTNTTDATQRLL